MNFVIKLSKKMYPHTNDIAKDITYVNVSHYYTVMRSHYKNGLISCPLYYFG